MKIWQKYFLKQVILTFFFILVALFLIYFIIDLSDHGIGLLTSHTSFQKIALFYLSNFSIHLDFFLPLSFLLASLKVILDLNSHRELVALQIAGLSKKKMLSPFYLFATLLSLFSYLNTEWLAPHAHEVIGTLSVKEANRKKKAENEHLHVLFLQDHSEFVYQSYDPLKKELFDIFWIVSKKEIWRMKSLSPKTRLAREVDHFFRGNDDLWQRTERAPERLMEELLLDEVMTTHPFIPCENQSIRSLFHQISMKVADPSIARAHFFYKIARPLLPFLILIVIAPLAMRFGRTLSPLLLIGCCLASFFGFMTLLDGMLLIGETRLLPASVAILSPFALVLMTRFRPFIQM